MVRQNKQISNGPFTNIDDWLEKYAEAARSIKTLKPNPELQKQRLYEIVKVILAEEILQCPQCGEKKVRWRCGHDF